MWDFKLCYQKDAISLYAAECQEECSYIHAIKKQKQGAIWAVEQPQTLDLLSTDTH